MLRHIIDLLTTRDEDDTLCPARRSTEGLFFLGQETHVTDNEVNTFKEDSVVRKLGFLTLVSIVSLMLSFVVACSPAAAPAPTPGKAPAAAPAGATPAAPSKAATPAAAAPAGSKDSIVIGLVTEVTGPQSGTGEAQTAAIKLAVDEWNAKGGIKGRPIELAIEDDQSNPTGAVNAFNKLVASKKPVAAIGPNFTNFLMAMEPYLKQAAIPLGTGASGVPVTSSGNPWFFRVRTNDAIVGKLAADYAVKELGFKKIGILHVTGDFGQAGAAVVKDSLEKLGVPPVGIEAYNADDKDVTAQLLNLQKAGAELVIGWAYPPDAGVVMTSLNQLGLKMKLLGSPAYGIPEALKIAKQAANGVYIVNDWLPSGDPETQAWIKKIESRQKQPANMLDAVYYDCANILFKAIEQGGTDPQAIRKAILATKGYKGMTGEFTFDEKGDGLRQVYVAEVKNEKQVLIKVIKEQ